jgi:hypothetical protein
METYHNKIKKEFEHERIEKCIICKKEIDTSKDAYSSVLDYNGDVLLQVGFYHTECLKSLIKGQTKVVTDLFREKLMNFSKAALAPFQNYAS